MPDSPKSFDDLVKGLPTFKATRKPAQNRTERDDPSTIYSVRGIGDLAREVLRRAPPPTAARMTRRINDAGLGLIKRFAGYELTAYQDLAGAWTIGWGHTGGVTEGMMWTQAQADQALLTDLLGTEAAVESAVAGVVTTDNQFAAMVCLAYNIGTSSFASSSVLREHRAGAMVKAADAFLMWNKAAIDGVLQVVEGLTKRRDAERALYLADDWSQVRNTHRLDPGRAATSR